MLLSSQSTTILMLIDEINDRFLEID